MGERKLMGHPRTCSNFIKAMADFYFRRGEEEDWVKGDLCGLAAFDRPLPSRLAQSTVP